MPFARRKNIFHQSWKRLQTVFSPRRSKSHSMASNSFSPDGTVPFVVGAETYQTWYKVFGEFVKRTSRPLVVLHGGPGMTHEYLLPISDLSSTRPVVFYDQFGNGRSSHVKDKGADFWAIDLFVDELNNLLSRLNIQDDFDLLGHSWGGILATEFELRHHPTGLKHMVLSDSLAAMSLWMQSNMQLAGSQPEEVQKGLMTGFADPKAYRAALEQFYIKHGCRVNPLPKEIATGVLDPIFGNKETGEGGDPTVALATNGGFLKNFTVMDRLHGVKVSTLLINGRYDIAQDFVMQPFFDKIDKVKWITFENSSHTPMWEERERYMKVVESFLKL